MSKTKVLLQIDELIDDISKLEHCRGIEREFGKGQVSKLQAKRHGLMMARQIVDEGLK